MKNYIVYVVFFLLLVFYSDTSYINAVPAYPYKLVVETGNGKLVTIFMKGDERQKYATTEDGYTVISDSDGWWYANLTDDGRIAKSDFKIMALEDETDELKQFKSNSPKGIRPRMINVQPQQYIMHSVNNARTNEPITGERRALVILMQYKDLRFKTTIDNFKALFNKLDYREGDAKGSVRDYYRFASQGQLDYIADVYGPYTSTNDMRYYGANVSYGGNDANPLELCIEAIKSLPDDIDLSLYDNDGNGDVDNVHIIYAGYGEEAGASANAIWAHEFPHRINLTNEVGYSFSSYSCSPELRSNHGSDITNIGVICHELGHALGAMDYYDTNYGTGGEYDGTGQWDIMANGSWNDNGRTPPNFNPYVRSTVFGWNKQSLLSSNQQVTLPRMELDNPEQSIIYRIETGRKGDYFLLENRQQHGFDAALPGAGLMIYHVHPDIDKQTLTNTINATSPQGLYPVCASYSEPSKKKYGNINSAECPFPGSEDVRAFAPTTSPAAVAWNGDSAKVSISCITLNSSNGSISFKTNDEVIEDPNLPSEMSLIYQESFETNITGHITVNSIAGKELWRTYTKGNFVPNADNIPEASDGRNLFMLFAGKGSQSHRNESEAVSKEIEVEAGENYIISFDVYSDTNFGPIPTFNMYIEDDYGEHVIFTLNEVVIPWKKIELPLTFTGNKIKYRMLGKVYTGGVFIDNIRLYKEQETTSLNDNYKLDKLSTDLYYLNGIKIGNYVDVMDHVPPGIYILKQGNFTRKVIIR